MSSTSDDAKDSEAGSTMGRIFRARRSRKQEEPDMNIPKWSFGVLNDKQTLEVPGSVLLMAASRNKPLGLRDVPDRTSHSSIPTGFHVDMHTTPGGARPASQSRLSADQRPDPDEGKKKTEDGTIILDPQPEESDNDPLNWPTWRRESALLSLGFYCMIGGGITAIMAAGFNNIAQDFDVTIETVSLSVGLYMMGQGVGAVFASPTAILFGKRPVYLASVIMFIATSVWAGYAASFPSLLAARVFQGISISPVECLPSATIAEIFFLHERAYRIGIYTLLLLGGKNLIPLVSAAIIGRFGWRTVFFIVSMVAGLGFILLFLFVPETFWDRTPTRKPSGRPSLLHRLSSHLSVVTIRQSTQSARPPQHSEVPRSPGAAARHTDSHVEFVTSSSTRAGHNASAFARSQSADRSGIGRQAQADRSAEQTKPASVPLDTNVPFVHVPDDHPDLHAASPPQTPVHSSRVDTPQSQDAHQQHSPYHHSTASRGAVEGHFSNDDSKVDMEKAPATPSTASPKAQAYTHSLRQQPAKTFTQQLRPFHGRLNNDNWFKVMVRPFILYSYPAVLWSAAVYSCSIGWLIVISETMAIIYRDPTIYNFDALQTGLVYLAPFIGGVLGTGVAGKVSDIVVRAMARRNGGVYEPEFRLVMVIPITITTCVGLMGFGWSAQIRDHWIVPTVFFGILSFGCALGSTTAITFCVDSYRQYAGEALVTLNFSKNVFHGLVFSLFVSHWMADDGPRTVYIWLGIIQLLIHLTTIPLFIFGKRARMWTVRKNLMEKY